MLIWLLMKQTKSKVFTSFYKRYSILSRKVFLNKTKMYMNLTNSCPSLGIGDGSSYMLCWASCWLSSSSLHCIAQTIQFPKPTSRNCCLLIIIIILRICTAISENFKGTTSNIRVWQRATRVHTSIFTSNIWKNEGFAVHIHGHHFIPCGYIRFYGRFFTNRYYPLRAVKSVFSY